MYSICPNDFNMCRSISLFTLHITCRTRLPNIPQPNMTILWSTLPTCKNTLTHIYMYIHSVQTHMYNSTEHTCTLHYEHEQFQHYGDPLARTNKLNADVWKTETTEIRTLQFISLYILEAVIGKLDISIVNTCACNHKCIHVHTHIYVQCTYTVHDYCT